MAAVQTFTRAEETALFRLICTGALSDKPTARASVDGGKDAAAAATSSVGAGSSSSSSSAETSLGASGSAGSAVWQFTIRDRGRIFAIAPTSLFQHHHSAVPPVAASATGEINATSLLEFEVVISPGGYPQLLSPRAFACAIASNGAGFLIDSFITMHENAKAPHPRKPNAEDAIYPHTVAVDDDCGFSSSSASSSASGAGSSASPAIADDSLRDPSDVWLMMYRLDNASGDAGAEFTASCLIPVLYLKRNNRAHVCTDCRMSRLLDGPQRSGELASYIALMESRKNEARRCKLCLSQRSNADSQNNPSFECNPRSGGMFKLNVLTT